MMKALLIIFGIGVALSFPAEKTEPSLEGGIGDLLRSITKIQDRVKEMRGIALGNFTDKNLENEIKEGVNAISKNVTYEDLIDRVQLASQKIKELQTKLSGTLSALDKKYPRPPKTEEKQEVETL
ncbi:Hypothetical protein NTJ_09563 [Nesidiocoris tenuis]|uniref:Uncharacterized protein n=1 Tax=Nesidiocoris tenuis TaxID=355587 RepID=A0ABN7B0M2_9HEMI|nr:Hypothetical protein NTJ_09563 [Nesidiocoris tenuis]